MADGRCMVCGRIIPEGAVLCLHCGDYDDMQTFKDTKREECEDNEREKGNGGQGAQ